jgi:hypothetical protein
LSNRQPGTDWRGAGLLPVVGYCLAANWAPSSRAVTAVLPDAAGVTTALDG